MKSQLGSILQQVLNTYLSNTKIFLENEKDFRVFWKEVYQQKFRITKRPPKKKKAVNPAVFFYDCLEQLDEQSRQLCLETVEIKEEAAIIEVSFVLVSESRSGDGRISRPNLMASVEINRENNTTSADSE